jgi:hypothetical protein
VGQRSKLVTADRYSHSLLDYREVDRSKVLDRARRAVAVHPPVLTPEDGIPSFAGAF